MSLNRVTIMGRMTRDPELRRTGSGIAVASFSIAVDDDYKDKNDERKTNFFDCVAWRNTGEFVSKYFTKGRMVVVDGKLDNRDWTDKEGNKRRSTEIIVDNIYFADSKKSDGQQAPQSDGYAAPGGYNAPGYTGGEAPAAGGYSAPAYTGSEAPATGGYNAPSGRTPGIPGFGYGGMNVDERF